MITPQTSRLSPVGWVIVLLMLGLGAYLGFFASTRSIQAGVVCVLVALFIAQLRVRITADDRLLYIRMRPFPSRLVPLDAIRDVSAHGKGMRGGLGYRWYGPGMWGLVTGGPEITINHGKDGEMVVASCPDPQRLAEELAAAGRSRGREVEIIER